MSTFRSTLLVALVSFTVLFANSHSFAAEELSDILQRSNWNDIIGTWIDSGTKGEELKVTYSWKIENRVIEITTQDKEKESVGLMGVNAKNGEVFHMGADSTGGSSLGKWEVDHNGDAILGLLFTSGDGVPGALRIRHHRIDTDTIKVILELPEPIAFEIVRVE